MSQVDLHGRVAIVTGAGGGLGRSHALLLASRGAQVVVNDVGDGSGGPTPAEAVVTEITDAGGRAVAANASVADADGAAAVVNTAVDAYGRVDVVVNNAGIVRDRSFAKMTMDEVDAVLGVHLRGAFLVTMAAWPHLRGRNYGRVVNTTSGAGLYGNFGQANYSAAKMGLVGFTRTLSFEGAKYGITANVISPLAASRMTEAILTPEMMAQLDPAFVSPVVAYLASEGCTDSGKIFVAGGGYVARVAIVEGDGVIFDHVPTPEEVAGRWDEIGRTEHTTETTRGAAEQTETILGKLQTSQALDEPGKL